MKYNCMSMYKTIKTVLIKHPSQAFISQDTLDEKWRQFNYLSPPDYKKSLEEYKTFEKILLENDIKPIYLSKSDNVGLDSIYTHDSLKITSKGAIYFNTGKVLRQKEGSEVEKILKQNNIPTLGKITSPGVMEGGDVVWIDEKTVAIGLGYRTNEEGIRQFKELTNDFIENYIIVPMPHADGEDECLHLMSIISIVDKNLAVVYSKFMPIFFRQYLIENGFELLEVTDHEYLNLGSNVLALSPRVCLIMDGNPKIEEKLLEAGCVVHKYSGSEISLKGTGGPTCLTCPIYRV